MVKYVFEKKKEIVGCYDCPFYIGCNCYDPECYFGIEEAKKREMGPVPENCPLVKVYDEEGN